MIWLFLACNQVDEEPPTSKRVEVQFPFEVLPKVEEISLEELSTIEPSINLLSTEQKPRIRGLVNLLSGPCEECADRSLAQCVIDTPKCSAAKRLLTRAIKNVDKGSKELVELCSFGDYWFPQALQMQEEVTVELWIDPNAPGKDLIWERLQRLKDAKLRICVRSQNIAHDLGFLPLKSGHKVTDKGAGNFEWEHIIDMDLINQKCSSALAPKVRSTPTWFVEGFRLRGHQSAAAIQRLIENAQLDRVSNEPN
ncbi:MAG: hypothetical protein VX278_04960 [Myxococcota bacterium]|nr:hypothetical protein [Myxococcota bacterium]